PDKIHSNLTTWYYLNISTGILLIVALAITTIERKPLKSIKEYWYWIGALAIAFLMTTPLSIPVWLIFKPLQVIGFPWRFLSIFCLAFTAFIAMIITTREKSTIFKNQWAVALATLLITLLLLSNGVFIYHKVKASGNLVKKEGAENIRERLIAGFEPEEHIPARVNIKKLNFTDNFNLLD